jgi:hypothetical protein
VPYFKDVVRYCLDFVFFCLRKVKEKRFNLVIKFSTTENLTVYVWNELQKKFQKDKSHKFVLYEIKILETEKNICIYRGE